MKKSDLGLTELRALVRAIIEEDATSGVPGAPMGRAVPPPLPSRSSKGAPAPASASLPAKGALHKFRADVNMAQDAMSKVKEAMDRSDTKEALRWLAKAIQFASSARTQLGQR